MAHSDQRQFLVTIQGLAGSFWAQTSGGDISLPNTKSYDGGSTAPQIVFGNPLVDDLVCTRNYDPQILAPIAAALKAGMNAGQPFTTTISQVATDPALSPLGVAPDVWQGTLTKLTTPKADASKSGANVATLALTFTCTKLT